MRTSDPIPSPRSARGVLRSRPPTARRLSIVCLVALIAVASPAWAARPRNPYSSFNLSGINYGAMRWERDRRKGKRVWSNSSPPGRAPESAGTSNPGLGTAGGTRIIRGR